ncbi:MAG: dethiobiotin synthase [Deltaproteobacteria bacterium]|nr:dethiobiotin synthase [Deltaproteobacteria bacterium]
MKNKDIYYVVGTDTGVGKTVLCLLLMQFFDHSSPFYIKPFQTGCTDVYAPDSDALFIYRHVKGLETRDPAQSVIFCFKNPKAPFFAARDEGKAVDMEVVLDVIHKKARLYSPVIVEAAGGLLVPVTEDILVVDTVKMIGARPVVVARAGLGTINHTLLSLEAMDRRGIVPAGIVFFDLGDPPTPKDMLLENMEAVEKYSGVKVTGVVGRIDNFISPEKDCYKPIEKLVSLS